MGVICGLYLFWILVGGITGMVSLFKSNLTLTCGCGLHFAHGYVNG
jgi:hypothetical protein